MSSPKGPDHTWAMTAAEPRGCVRCQVVKPAAAFPPHGRRNRADGYGSVTRLCWSCVEIEAWDLYARGYHCHRRGPRADWRQGQNWMRRCSLCGRAKRRGRLNFAPLKEGGYARTCRRCRHAISKRALARQYDREADRLRAHNAARARERRALPEVKRSERAARKRWRAKVMADPKRAAALRETERIARALRDERRGKPLPTPGLPPTNFGPMIPARPLAEAIRRVAERHADLEALARYIGVSARTFNRWREPGAMASLGRVEAVLRDLGPSWPEVYPPSEYPEVYDLLSEGVAA